MQGEEVEPARAKAKAAGVKDIFIDDLKEEFVRDYVFPMFRCEESTLASNLNFECASTLDFENCCRANSLYEGVYLLGTSIARPLIAKRQIEIAAQVGADAVSHGATGKGNDQVRFELGCAALQSANCAAAAGGSQPTGAGQCWSLWASAGRGIGKSAAGQAITKHLLGCMESSLQMRTVACAS